MPLFADAGGMCNGLWIMSVPTMDRAAGQADGSVAVIRDQVKAHLAGRSGTWLGSFCDAIALADNAGVRTDPLRVHVAELFGPRADGEVDDIDIRDALVEALVGRRASVTPRSPGASSRLVAHRQSDVP
jgi:hypothetical protein